jgi:hypothetical protein
MADMPQPAESAAVCHEAIAIVNARPPTQCSQVRFSSAAAPMSILWPADRTQRGR